MPSYIDDDVPTKNKVESDLDEDDDEDDDDEDDYISDTDEDNKEDDENYNVNDDDIENKDDNKTGKYRIQVETDDENEDMLGMEEDNDEYTMDENEDEIDDTEDDIFQKFNNYSLVENLEKEHPEIRSINIDEIKALTKIVRDKNGRIIDPLHTTIPFLTKYEKARIIGARAEQLDRGAPTPLQNQLPETIIHGRTIALAEFEKKTNTIYYSETSTK